MDSSNQTKILVVDDSASNRLLLSFMLQELGYVIEEAENGEQAVEKALETDFVAIFMDLNMPVMNGVEATEILRNLSFESSIFACSAEDNPEKIEKLLHSGFNDFVPKPIEPECINSLLRKHSVKMQPELTIDNNAYKLKLEQLSNRFIDNIPVIVAKAEKALANNSIADLKRIAHKLKGTASQFGFDKVTRISKDIESAINKGKISAALDKTHFLISELKRNIQGS